VLGLSGKKSQRLVVMGIFKNQAKEQLLAADLRPKNSSKMM